jgi:predicted amidohydrolase
MFMALELDRSNLAQAVTDNLLKELKMNTHGTLDLGAHQKISLEIPSSSWHFCALSCRLS